MIATTYHKIITRQIIAGFLFLAFLLMYDTVLDILLSGLYVIYEIIEFSAEELVEYLFHTDHHQSEIIVIYVFFFIFLYALYRFLRALPRLSRRFKRRISLRWARKKTRIYRYWHAFSSFQKVKLLSLYGISTSLIIVWLFFL